MKVLCSIKLSILLSGILFSLSMRGENLTFGDITLEIPDSMEFELHDNGILTIVGNDCAIYFATLGDPAISDKVNFDSDEIFNNLDRKLFPIDKYYGKQSEEAHTMGIYYPEMSVRRVYTAYDDPSDTFVTYTFYTPKRPYVAAINYHGDNCPSVFEDVADSIDDSSSFFSRQWFIVKDGFWLIIVLAFLSLIICHIIGYFCNREKNAVKIGVIITILFTIGFFVFFPKCIFAGVLIAILCFIFGCGGAYCSFSMMLESVLKEL